MNTPFDNIFRMVSLSKNRQLKGFDFTRELEDVFKYHQQLAIENWYFYDGLHQLFFERFEAEDDFTFINRQKNATIENHVKPIIDIICSHLYSGEDTPKRYVLRKGEPDPKLNDWFKETVWSHQSDGWVDDGKALNALVTGFTVVKRNFIDVRTDREFTVADSALSKVKFGIIKKSLVDSTCCLPIPYRDENGVTHPTKLGAIYMMYTEDSSIGSSIVANVTQSQPKRESIIEYIDNDYWLKFVIPEGSNKPVQVPVNPGSPFQNKNQFRDVNIPYTLYRNTGDPFYLTGQSEVTSIKSINMEINELGNGDKNTIRYHQYPIMQGVEGAQLPDNFVRTKNAVLELDGKGAKFEYLTWDNDLDASDRRQESLRRAMSMVSGVGLIARGYFKEIGQIRSGPPLKVLFASDRSTMSRKFKVFRLGEKDEMRADVKFYEKLTGVNFSIDKTVEFKVDFEDDFMGIDELLQQEIDALRVNKTVPLEDVIKEENPELSQAEVDAKVKEIEKSSMKAAMNPRGTQSPEKSKQIQEKPKE